ncbi:MAG: hypothetical protein JSU01_08745 [Bacteroidetes bacterium]|nr:hypothetical protein [Bacteroidota bacterium]
MKRYLLSIIAIMIILSACKKDAVNKKVNDNKTTPVTFSVGYSQAKGGFNGAVNISKSKFGPHTLAVDTTLAKYASVIYVGVYTTSGDQLFLTKQLATDTVFGTVNYNLAPGNYIVTFAAGQTGMIETGTTLNNTYINYGIGGNGMNPWQNTFFQKLNLTVGSSSINQNVTMNRIGAQLVVNIEDAVPSNVKSIIVSMTDNPTQESGNAFAVGSETAGIPGNPPSDPGLMYAYTPPTTAITAGTKNLKFCIAFLKVAAPYTVTIGAYNQVLSAAPNGPPANLPNTTVAFVVIPNVTAQDKAQTILSGKLFGGNGLTNTGGFQMTIDPQWSTTTTTIPFQ